MFIRLAAALGLAASLASAVVAHSEFHLPGSNRSVPAPRIAPLPNGGNLQGNPVQLSWTEPAKTAVAGFAYTVDQLPQADPPRQVMTAGSSASVPLPADGDWYIHLSAEDEGGHWSQPTTVTLHLDSLPLTIGDVSLSAPAFNPAYDVLTVKAPVSKPSAEVTATIVLASSGQVVRTLTAANGQWQWDGKTDAGNTAAIGSYRFSIQATDAAGRQVLAKSEPFTLTNKRIVVSLSNQVLSAYEGDNVIMRTVVTTGGPELPTPTGTFHVLGKYTNLEVYSPWPKGSPYWFENVTYQYAMDFLESPQYGLYIHDASWRSIYGPGSNTVDGTPGTDYTGTHGCINVPLEAEEALYTWATAGMPVVIKN